MGVDQVSASLRNGYADVHVSPRRQLWMRVNVCVSTRVSPLGEARVALVPLHVAVASASPASAPPLPPLPPPPAPLCVAASPPSPAISHDLE